MNDSPESTSANSMGSGIEQRNENGQRKRQKRRPLFIVMTLLLASGVVLVAGELMLRCYVWARGWTPNCYTADADLFVPHPERGYDLSPNFRLRSGVFQITTNSQGFRGPTIDPARKSVLRVAVLGGSSVFGYLVNDGEEAARLLESQLRDELGEVEVINGGVPGYNLFQTGSRFDERIKPLKPDIVVLYLGYNDLPYVTSDEPESNSFRFRESHLIKGWHRAASASVLYGFVGNRLLGTVTAAPNRHWRTEPTIKGELQFQRNVSRLIESARESGAKVIVCSQALAAHDKVDPGLKSHLPEDSEDREAAVKLAKWLETTLATLAEQHGTEFVNCYQQIPGTAKFLGDDVHLTREGEQLLSDLLAATIIAIQTAAP